MRYKVLFIFILILCLFISCTREDVQVPEGPGDKLTREPYGMDAPHVLQTENFTLWWGDLHHIPDGWPEFLLQALEQSWTVYFDELRFPVPAGLETYRLNVYFTDSFSGGPSFDGGGSKMDLDPEGFPMIMMAEGDVTRISRINARDTAAHEFFHAVQAGTGAYVQCSDCDPGTYMTWWSEGTAVWGANEVVPDLESWSGPRFCGIYAMYPHLALTHHRGVTQTSPLVDWRHYGTWMFARFLSEVVADTNLIRDSWSTAGDEKDPMAVLTRLLENRGLDLPAVFADFAAETVTYYSFEHSDIFRAAVENMARDNPGDNFRWAAIHTGNGILWTVPPSTTLPQHHAFNLIRLENPVSGRLTVAFDGDPAGNLGTPSTFALRLVKETADSHEILTVPVQNFQGSLELDVTNEVAFTLVVAVWDGAHAGEETFGYRYKLQIN